MAPYLQTWPVTTPPLEAAVFGFEDDDGVLSVTGVAACSVGWGEADATESLWRWLFGDGLSGSSDDLETLRAASLP